jgi:hypothetical protein
LLFEFPKQRSTWLTGVNNGKTYKIGGKSIMKVRIFTNEGDAPRLENEINKWLLDNKNIQVKHIKQDYAYDNEQSFCTLISLWYEKGVKDIGSRQIS